MKRLLSLALCCLTVSLPAYAQTQNSSAMKNDNYIRNGDFEKAIGGKLSDWKISGKIEPEAASGVWKRLTATFRSDSHKTVAFFFNMPLGTAGTIWIDNFVVGPNIQFQNSSFEELDVDGGFSGWQQTNKNGTVFSDSNRVSEGRKSVRVTHAHEAVPETRIWQDFAVEPNKEYSLSFDMFVGDDFQGEARGWLYDASHGTSIDFDYQNLLASKLVEARDRLGRFNVVMTPTRDSPGELSQEIVVMPNSNLQATLDLENSAFKGSVKMVIEDAASGRVLHQVDTTTSQEKWQTVNFAFQNLAAKVRVRVIAEGEGTLRVDNIAVTSPQVTPSLQQVQWLQAQNNFRIPARLKVSVQDVGGKVIDSGLALLNKDLKSHGVVVEKQSAAAAPLQILIGAKHAVKGKGNEAYSLDVDSKQVVIKAGTQAGAFYGLMTLLQLIDSREGKPVFLPCKIVDFPDMPMRGFLYGDEEQAARWKMNTVMVSTGFPTTPAEKQNLRELVEKCRSLNLDFIPMFITLTGGYYVEKINPNLAAGIWVQDEKLTLRGEEPANLANPYVIRTALSDVKLKSADGAKEYVLGVDYRVIDGEMKYDYDNPNAKPFAVVRMPNSAIEDGSTILASYDWVSHHRKRHDVHVAYVPLEPEVRKLTGDFLSSLAKEYDFSYINPSHDLHEFEFQDHQLETDSRVIKSGKKPIELLADDVRFQAGAIKEGNPKTRIFQWTGSVGDYAKAAGPLLPKDVLINIWGYDSSWPSGYGREAMEYWTKLGFETSVMPWDNLRNIRGWAQVVAEAQRKGYPCKGMVGSAWASRIGGFQETANVSWKIPKKGDKNFVALP